MDRPESNEEDFIKLRVGDENVDAIVLKKEQTRMGVALEFLYKDKNSQRGYMIERIGADDPNILTVYNEKKGPRINRTIANELSFFASVQTEFPISKVTGGRKRRSARRTRRTRHNKKSKIRVIRKSKRR